MPYLYLTACVFLCASSSVFGKIFTRDNGARKDSTVFYNFLVMLSVFLGWGILYIIDFSFDVGVLRYSALFALCYVVCFVGIINALKYGPATLTSLFVSLSLILTTVWGFIFWGSEVTPTVIFGIVLVVCSIILCVYSNEKDETKISLKWIFYISLALFGNAGTAIVQRTQQVQYNGQHGNMLMAVAAFLSALVYLFIYLKSDRRDTSVMLKTSWWPPVCTGLCNLVLNVFIMLMTMTDLSPSLIYPTIGVGGLAVVTVFSLVVFKEKMSGRQWIGVAIGAVAVALLSI